MKRLILLAIAILIPTAGLCANGATTPPYVNNTRFGNHSTQTTTAHGGIVATTDSRLTDSRTPTAHKTSHATGGTDVLTPADIGAFAATGGTVTGNTTVTNSGTLAPFVVENTTYAGSGVQFGGTANGYGAIWNRFVTTSATNWNFKFGANYTYLNAGSTITCSINGVDKIYITATGLGIGIATPAGRLDIKGADLTTGIGLQTQDSGGTVKLQVLNNGEMIRSGITKSLAMSKVLTSGAAAVDLFTFTLAAGESISGEYHYSLTATGTISAAAEQYEHNGVVFFAYTNRAGTIVSANIVETEGVTVKSTGNGTFTDNFTNNGTTAAVKLTVDASGLTTPIVTIRGEIKINRPATITLN